MNLDSLRRRINRMIEQLEPRRSPRTWVITQEEGLGIPDRLYPLIAPFDRIVIQEMPKGYLGPGIEPTFYSY